MRAHTHAQTRTRKHTHTRSHTRQAFLESTGTNRVLQEKVGAHNMHTTFTNYSHNIHITFTQHPQVFKCFLSWVRHGGIPPEELSSNPLFRAVFDALNVPELFEVSNNPR